MRKFLLAIALAAIAMPAFATDSGDAAFEILANFETEKRQQNFIKLQSSIGLTEAAAIDEKMTEIYGAPSVSRSGLKVWEVENRSGSGPKHTTIMCGPDGNGGLHISVDRRGKASNKASKGSENKFAKTKRRKGPTASKPIATSLERD